MSSRESGSGIIDGGSMMMEGWLYLIRCNRLGLQFSRKRYFVLRGHHLRTFKSPPPPSSSSSSVSNNNQQKLLPLRSAFLDSSVRVVDNGRETINRKVFFIFTLYSSSNHSDQLKLGASCSEEAARWIHSIQEVSLKGALHIIRDNAATCSKRRWHSFRLCGYTSTSHCNSIDWTLGSSDVVAPSSWTIFGCQNGLRLFKEAKERSSRGKRWDDHPAIMAVGVVDGTSESIFQTLMSLGPSRSAWDFCFHKGSVVEHLDGHTDIIHKQLYSDCLPWGSKARDFLLQRYWRREDDGTYVVLYHSVIHKKCPPQKGCVRACLKSGGYVITPVNNGKQSVVKHMLAIDWKFWRSYLKSSSAHSVTIHMLGRVAALRELFRARPVNCSPSDNSSGELTRNTGLPPKEVDINSDIQTQAGDENVQESSLGGVDQTQPEHASLVSLNDADDEFFDVPEPSDSDDPENGWMASCSHNKSPDICQPRLSSAANFLKKLHDLADWLRSNKREDDLGGRPGSIVQKYAAKGGPEFFFIVNIQVPGSTTYNLALYYMMTTPVEDTPLLESFIKGDDTFRNSRFKLIPYISEGSWIVKQSVGKKACLIGQALEINYFQGKNYLELGVDIGSSTVARGVVSLVLGYLNHQIIEMAFLIQGNTREELPEFLLGTCHLNHLDASKSVCLKP